MEIYEFPLSLSMLLNWEDLCRRCVSRQMLVTGDEFLKKEKEKKTKEWRKIINANVFLCCTSIIEWFEVAVSSIFIWVS